MHLPRRHHRIWYLLSVHQLALLQRRNRLVHVNMLNLKSNHTPWSNFPEGHPSYTTPAQARLTSEFYPTPAPAHLTGTCWYIYHINPIKPCWCLGLCSCSWVWWNFEKIFQTSRSYYVSYFKHFFQKKKSKPIFFSVTSGAPRCGAPLLCTIAVAHLGVVRHYYF
jgi:hypothetical protein